MSVAKEHDDYVAAWPEAGRVTGGDEFERAMAALPPTADEAAGEVIKLAGDGVSAQTHRAMLEAGVHPEQEAIEARRLARQEPVAAPAKGQVGNSTISQSQADDLVKILVRRDPRLTPQAAREMATRMNAAKGIQVAR